MAEIREKSGPGALLLGFLGFVAFEVAAYYLLPPTYRVTMIADSRMLSSMEVMS